MMVFNPLWETLKEKNISIYTLIHKHNISRGMIDNLKHNRNVQLSTVERMCEILDCRIEDVVQYCKNEEPADG